MDYEITPTIDNINYDDIRWHSFYITCLRQNSKQVVKSLKLYDNLQHYILVLLEETSFSSPQLKQLLEEFIRIRDE